MRDRVKNFVSFYGDVRTELKKVTWPSKKEVYGTTLVVLITVMFFGFYLFVVDWILQFVVNSVFQAFAR